MPPALAEARRASDPQEDKLGLLDTASPDKSSYVEEWANRHCLPPGLESPSSPEGTKSR